MTTSAASGSACAQAKAEELPAYQQQMSILAYLDPGPYGEMRTPIPLVKACVGLIHQGCYYLIPACLPGSDRPADVQAVRAMVAATLAQTDPANQPSPAPPLAQIKRAAWPELRSKLDQGLVQELDRLRFAPILINCDHDHVTCPWLNCARPSVVWVTTL